MLQQISETHSDFTGVSNPLPCSWLPVLGFWSSELPWLWHFEEQWLFILWNIFQFGYMIHQNSDELIHFGGRILADTVHVSQYGGTLMLICMITGWFSLNYFTKGGLTHSFTVAVLFFLLMISNYLLRDLGSACLRGFPYTFTHLS